MRGVLFIKLNELLDKTLREVLDEYCAIYSPECDYWYGVTSYDDIDELYEHYNIEEEYSEAFVPTSIIDDELIISFDEELMDYNKLEHIMNNLGISKKK